MNEPQRIAEILLAEPEWSVICHVRPDGDTLGCASALVCAGKKLGKKVQWGGVDILPPQYSFLPHASEYQSGGAAPRAGKCVVAVDVSTRDRGVPGMSVRVAIDHHRDNEQFGSEVNWVVPGAAATGELVYEVLLAMGCPPDKDAATALYTAIMTDCGGFRFSNTTYNTMRVAAELVKAGAVPAEIDKSLYYNDTPAKLRLWGRCLSRAKKTGEHAVLSWVSRADFRETGAAEPDTDGLVNMLTRVKGADLTVFACEERDAVRCSVRARDSASAQEIAARHGGGGHRYAAGCKIRLPLEEALALLEEELERV